MTTGEETQQRTTLWCPFCNKALPLDSFESLLRPPGPYVELVRCRACHKVFSRIDTREGLDRA